MVVQKNTTRLGRGRHGHAGAWKQRKWGTGAQQAFSVSHGSSWSVWTHPDPSSTNALGVSFSKQADNCYLRAPV